MNKQTDQPFLPCVIVLCLHHGGGGISNRVFCVPPHGITAHMPSIDEGSGGRVWLFFFSGCIAGLWDLFPDQGSNLMALNWKVDSQTLNIQ